MPALDNIRHERFARHWIKTGVASVAYQKAGYVNKTRNARDVNACRLLSQTKVQRRIRELKHQMAARNRVTVDSLLQDLADDRALARDLGQPGAAIQATQLSAKLVGLLVDRKESGAPGDFAGLQSADEVLALVTTELGAETAALLAKALGKQAVEPIEVAEITVVDTAYRDPTEPLN
jgi:phage terminase small subunit